MCSAVLCQTAPVHWGRRIRDERERRGWTRVELAERVGCDEGTIRALEKQDAPPVRSKYAPVVSALLGIGDDVVASENPRLYEASALQLAERLAELLAADDASRERHDVSNVRTVEWRGVPFNQTHPDDSASVRALQEAERDSKSDDAPPSPA